MPLQGLALSWAENKALAPEQYIEVFSSVATLQFKQDPSLDNKKNFANQGSFSRFQELGAASWSIYKNGSDSTFSGSDCYTKNKYGEAADPLSRSFLLDLDDSCYFIQYAPEVVNEDKDKWEDEGPTPARHYRVWRDSKNNPLGLRALIEEWTRNLRKGGIGSDQWVTILFLPVPTRRIFSLAQPFAQSDIYFVCPVVMSKSPDLYKNLFGINAPRANPCPLDQVINFNTSIDAIFHVPDLNAAKYGAQWPYFSSLYLANAGDMSLTESLSADSGVGSIGGPSTSTTIHIHPGASVGGSIDASSVIAQNGSEVEKLISKTAIAGPSRFANESAYKPNGNVNNGATEAAIALIATAVVGGIIAAVM